MERADLLELAFLLWGDEREAEARVDQVQRGRTRGDDTVRALLRTREPSVVTAAREDPWWLDPSTAARGAQVASVLAGLELPVRAAAVLVGLGTATPPELGQRFGLVPIPLSALGPDPRGALLDRLTARLPPARDDVQAAAAVRTDRWRRRSTVGAALLLMAGGLTWLVVRPPSSPAAVDDRPAATAARPSAAPVGELVRLGPGDTTTSLAASAAVAAAGAPADAARTVVWSGRFDTGVAGLADGVVVRVTLPDGPTVVATAFAQGRADQTFLVAGCGVQPDGPVSAARCSTADPGTGTPTTTVLVTGLTTVATLVDAQGLPLDALLPGADGAATVRDDAAAGVVVRLDSGTEVAVAAP